jgi:DNA-binding transcriptional MerR regulator
VAWSTRELADLAGSTVRAVRHYHQVGLLEEPERLSNGYKQYGVSHLLRLLQIKRLTDLGVPLAQIASMADAQDDPAEALRLLDADIAASIERLQRVRAELALILEHRAPLDLPAGFGAVGSDLSTADRRAIAVWGRLFDEDWMDELREILADEPRTATDDEVDALPEDADESTRERLARALAPAIRRQLARQRPAAESLRLPGGQRAAARTIQHTLHELYNPAQLDVFQRAHRLATEGPADDPGTDHHDERGPA